MILNLDNISNQIIGAMVTWKTNVKLIIMYWTRLYLYNYFKIH